MSSTRVRNPLDHSRPVHAPHPDARDGRVWVDAAAPDLRPSEEPEVIKLGREHRVITDQLMQSAKEGTSPSGFGLRLVSGAIYVLLTLACVMASDITCAVYLAALCGVCSWEFFVMLRADAKLPNETIGVVAATLFPLATCFFGGRGIMAVLFLLMVALLVWYVFFPRARVADVAVSLLGALYTGLMMCGAMVLRLALPDYWGGVLLVAVLVSIWGNDSFAYLVGSAIGKHKMVPTISPKKSWEGFFGGMACSVLVWVGISYIPGVEVHLAVAAILGLLCGCAGVLGDLVESRIKRSSGFKDSGFAMPGHGGLLDRCDSQFLVFVVAALGLVLSGGIPLNL
ncbi:MAG: phosphatidate cytidylyltransferase [Coriobacteriia bacterium]|nr:phosphatidate cytidylyltransferase [Coriobacteriia bacterium]